MPIENVPYGGVDQTIVQTGDTGYGDYTTQLLQAFAQFGFQNPADFSNSTLALRQYIQTITPNAPTALTLVPSGNSTSVSVELYSDSGLANGSALLLGSDGTTRAYLNSAKIGTGQVLPLDLQIGATTAIRITPSGRVLVNTTTDDGVHNLQVNGSISGTSFTGLALSGNLAGGAAGSVVYQTSPTTTGFLPVGASGNILSSTGASIAWISAPAGINVPYVSTRSYCTAAPNTGGVDHGGVMFSGSNYLSIPAGPFVFTSGMVGQGIYVSGAFGGAYTTIASYIGPQLVTTTASATATSTLAQVVVFTPGQDDTAGFNSFTAAAGGSQSGAQIAGGRAYVVDFTALNPIPSGVQWIRGDGLNSAFIISKVRSNAVHKGGIIWKGMSSNSCIGGQGQGFTIIGPGVYASQQLLGSAISITNGVLTATISNGNTANVGSTYKITGARGTASPYNDTYWTITSSSSTQFVGTPTYLDENPVLGNISNVTVDGSGNLTVVDSNPYRKINYFVNFSGMTATALNGNSYQITSVNYSTPGNPNSSVVGYTFANTGLSTYASTPDSGIGRYLADNAGVTDNFVSFPALSSGDGMYLVSNDFPGGTNINTHLHINDVVISQFQGAGCRIMTPNFGDLGTLTCNSNSEGLAMESMHATSGYFTNPSCYSINGGCEFESNTFVGLYVRNFGGGTIEMPGIGGSGIAVLLYNCSGTTFNGGDLEVQTPWAPNTTLYPGHSIELRGSTGVRVNPTYISFNNSVGQMACYMWNSCVSCVYERSRHFLAGGNVQPTYEVYIEGTCVGCDAIEPYLVGGNITNWFVDGSSNFIYLKGKKYNSTQTNLATFVSLQNVGSITVNAVQSPHVTFTNTTNTQSWNVGSNQPSAVVGFFDNLAGTWGLQIADTTHVVTLPSTVASSSTSTGALIVKGGVGIAGGINIGGNSSITNAAGSAILTITGTTLAQTDYISSINGQQWNNGYNQPNLAYSIFNTTLALTALSIADATNQITVSALFTANGGVASNGNVTITSASNPQLQIVDTTTPQRYNIGHNTVSGVLNLAFDATASLSRLTVADGTGVINIPTVVASTSTTTGSLTIGGGLGVGQTLHAAVIVSSGAITATTGNITASSGNIVASGTISSGGHLVPTVNNTPTFTTVGTPGTIGSSTLAVFPSGYIEATGISTSVISGGSTGTITFPTAFPTNCWNVQVTCFDAGTNAFFYGAVASFSASSFVWYNNTGGGTPYVMWRAIGN